MESGGPILGQGYLQVLSNRECDLTASVALVNLNHFRVPREGVSSSHSPVVLVDAILALLFDSGTALQLGPFKNSVSMSSFCSGSVQTSKVYGRPDPPDLFLCFVL